MTIDRRLQTDLHALAEGTDPDLDTVLTNVRQGGAARQRRARAVLSTTLGLFVILVVAGGVWFASAARTTNSIAPVASAPVGSAIPVAPVPAGPGTSPTSSRETPSPSAPPEGPDSTATPDTTATTDRPNPSVTTTTGRSPATVPDPHTYELRTLLVSTGSDPDTAPGELFTSTAGVPICGVLTGGLGVTPTPESVLTCIEDDLASRRETVVLQMLSTIEGDPMVVVIHVLPDGSITYYEDSTRDAFGSGAWSKGTCDDQPVWAATLDPANLLYSLLVAACDEPTYTSFPPVRR